jgi:hypothetical protein
MWSQRLAFGVSELWEGFDGALPKGVESITESGPGYIAAHSVTLQTVRDVLRKSFRRLR